MPPKTVIEKLESPSPAVTVFRIAGTLGFHEKDTLAKLLSECKKRGMTRIVFDVAELNSLGGGCAKILREEVAGGELTLGIASAKSVVLKFLQKDKDLQRLVVAATLLEAVEAVERSAGSAVAPVPDDLVTETDDELVSEESLEAVLGRDVEDQAEETTDATLEQVGEAIDEAVGEAQPSGRQGDAEAKTPDPNEPEILYASSRPSEKKAADAAVPPAPPSSADAGPAAAAQTPVPDTSHDSASPRELKKRIVQHNTLLTINAEFARMTDRKSLLDAFLLTTIAQVGVESAVFLEHSQGYFVPAASKGIEVDELRGFAISDAQMHLDQWLRNSQIYTLDKAHFGDDVKAPLLSLGCSYVVPFIVMGKFRGIVLLGKPIKDNLDEVTLDFLKILVNQAAVAFESLSRFEEESERTLGLVQTLIALTEENTLARGSTQILLGYVYELATRLNYVDDMRDLMYGAMLRDIGMIKVSDLIVRSPRELMPEEWEIIKRHTLDGAAMLEKMKFGKGAVSIVLSHHERFNGEGYPHGLHGQDIPMGARIVSVVESYAAMLHERPTRPALSPEEALDTLKENWGMRYDPEVVKHFVDIVEEELRSGAQVFDRKFEHFNV